MSIVIRKFEKEDIDQAIEIWNEVVRDGIAFPQIEELTKESGIEFFESQTYTGVAYDTERKTLVGLYILHPNNVGRCGHICNASYAVSGNERGRHIGEILVKDCLVEAREAGYRILQFNAVVRSNEAAISLYHKLGFIQLGVIPNGFLMKDGTYQDIIPHYYELV